LQWQVSDVHDPFLATDCVMGDSATDCVMGNSWVEACSHCPHSTPYLVETAKALGPDPLKHWRSRIVYQPVGAAAVLGVQHSPWLGPSWAVMPLADFRTQRNEPPVIDGVMAENPPHYEGKEVSIVVYSAADPDGDSATLAYAVRCTPEQGYGAALVPALPPARLTCVFPDQGDFTVSVRVHDIFGAFDTETLQVPVANLDPIIESVTNDGPVEVGTRSARIDVVAIDPVDPLSYEFNCGGGGGFVPSSDPWFYCGPYGSAGSFDVQVRALDGDGGHATGRTTVEVEPDEDGDCMLDVCESEYFPGQEETVSGEDDADGDGLTNAEECAIGRDPTTDERTPPSNPDPAPNQTVSSVRPVLSASPATSAFPNDRFSYVVQVFDETLSNEESVSGPAHIDTATGRVTFDGWLEDLSDRQHLSWQVVWTTETLEVTTSCDPTRRKVVVTAVTERFPFTVRLANTPPEPPTILVPKDAQVVRTTKPRLEFQHAHDADGDSLTYEVELYRSGVSTLEPGTDDRPIFVAHDVAESPAFPGADSSDVQVAEELARGRDYCWRARARDSDAFSAWTSCASFVIPIDLDPSPGTSDIGVPRGCACDNGDSTSARLGMLLVAAVAILRRLQRRPMRTGAMRS
jgi:hypothetical protein